MKFFGHFQNVNSSIFCYYLALYFVVIILKAVCPKVMTYSQPFTHSTFFLTFFIFLWLPPILFLSTFFSLDILVIFMFFSALQPFSALNPISASSSSQNPTLSAPYTFLTFASQNLPFSQPPTLFLPLFFSYPPTLLQSPLFLTLRLFTSQRFMASSYAPFKAFFKPLCP